MFQKKIKTEGEKINSLSKDLAELNFTQNTTTIPPVHHHNNNNDNTYSSSKGQDHSKPNKKKYVFINKSKEPTEVKGEPPQSSSSSQQPSSNKTIPLEPKSMNVPQKTITTHTSSPSPYQKQVITKPAISANDSPRTQFKKTIEHNKLFIFNQVEDAKIILTKINNIREEIKQDNDSKKQLEEQITQLTEKQNELIEANNFDEVIKVEEEINLNTEKINVINQSMQIQSETNLFLLNIEMIDLLKITVDQINEQTQGMSSFIKEATEERDKLNQTDKKSIDELTQILKTKEEETETINRTYQSAIKKVGNEEAFFNKQIDDATAELTQQTKDLLKQKEDITYDILKLREQLKLKEEALLKVNEQIDLNINEKNIIKAKFEIDESYAEAIELQKSQQIIYDKVINEFNSLKAQHASEIKQYQNKLDALNNIIESITHSESVTKIKNKKLLDTIEEMKSSMHCEKDKVNQFHSNEKTIEDYLKKIIENNESIEEIDLQTKRILNDIQSFESNINNLEDVKKAHVSKKQFKDAQTVNLEIKKYIESKDSLIELVKENNDEIKRIIEEIEVQKAQSEKISKENEVIKEEIGEENQKYLKMYLEILLEFENGIIKDNDLESDLIKEEIKQIQQQIIPDKKENDDQEANKKDEDASKENDKEKEESKEEDDEKVIENEQKETKDEKATDLKEENITIPEIEEKETEIEKKQNIQTSKDAPTSQEVEDKNTEPTTEVINENPTEIQKEDTIKVIEDKSNDKIEDNQNPNIVHE